MRLERSSQKFKDLVLQLLKLRDPSNSNRPDAQSERERA